MTYYDKLVRDKIPEILCEKNKGFVAHQVPPEELLPYLKKKLLEEATEFVESSSPEDGLKELADVEEVISALLKEMDWTIADLRAARMDKINKRGAFDDGWILMEVDDD